MLGIIIWALLIIFICICIDGWNLLIVVLACGIVCIALYSLYHYIQSRYYETSLYSDDTDLISDNVLADDNSYVSTRDDANEIGKLNSEEILNPDALNNNAENLSINKNEVIDSHQHIQPKCLVKGVSDSERNKLELGYKICNILVDGIRHKTAVTEDLDDLEYAKAKLMSSYYPFSWNKYILVDIRNDILLIKYLLPNIDDIPDILEIKYIKEQPSIIEPNDNRLKEIWSKMTFDIVIRSIYELFYSPFLNKIESINFNGFVKSLDVSTGNLSEKCILSIIVQRSDFETLDLSRIDSKQCFKRFKGISAHNLSSLTPVPPLMSMNKNDNRFVDSYEVISNIAGENLAAMDWKDFENLIRELFEKEFSTSDCEVKITRASKDGGVDAVIFDTDPIRGCKIIIQAKRYTNIVGLSAVRDLYGTVVNEGATKGILVTTSDYGADSYNFIKDKPLTLLNGANLLHLLERHGYQAHIDIAKAKKLLNSLDNE